MSRSPTMITPELQALRRKILQRLAEIDQHLAEKREQISRAEEQLAQFNRSTAS